MIIEVKPAALILTYVRPDGVKGLIESCIQNDVPRIYISVDGPRSDPDRLLQKKIFEIVERFQKRNGVQIFLQNHEQNLGVGAGVISGLDWFFSLEESGHILEDDLIIDSDFFEFSRLALREYRDYSSVKMISGSQLISEAKSEDQANWCNYPMIWGWSSWSSKWLEMKTGLLKEQGFTYFRMNSHITNFWAIGANRVLQGKIDTWDTPLAAEFYRKRWLCIIPPKNLVVNYGNDQVANHTMGNTFGLNLPIDKLTETIDFDTLNTSKNITVYNKLLEKYVFRIKRRHYFANIYGPFIDRRKYPSSYAPLYKRLSTLASKL
jgi:hypothetical protein